MIKIDFFFYEIFGFSMWDCACSIETMELDMENNVNEKFVLFKSCTKFLIIISNPVTIITAMSHIP